MRINGKNTSSLQHRTWNNVAISKTLAVNFIISKMEEKEKVREQPYSNQKKNCSQQLPPTVMNLGEVGPFRPPCARYLVYASIERQRARRRDHPLKELIPKARLFPSTWLKNSDGSLMLLPERRNKYQGGFCAPAT